MNWPKGTLAREAGQRGVRIRFRGSLGAAAIAGLVSCEESSVEAPAPERIAAGVYTAPPHAIPLGLIEAPVLLDLRSTVAQLEEAIPRTIGDIERRIPVEGNNRVHLAYRLRREDFTVGFRADTIRLSTILHYRVRGWFNPPVLPEVSASCGTGAAPEPRVRLALGGVVRLDSTWRLRARTRLVRLEPMSREERDQCEVSLARIDMTGRVMNAAREFISGRMRVLDQALARLDVRTPLENIWRTMQEPIRLQDSLWMVLQPEGVGVGMLGGNEREVGTRLQLTTRPRIVAGPRPNLPFRPLPPLGQAIGGEGFQIMVEGRFPYDALSDRLDAELAGLELRVAGMRAVVRRVSVYPTAGRQLALGLDVAGSVAGRVYLVGTPALDSTGTTIGVPDLDFDPGSAGLLVRGLSWLGSNRIRNALRERARVSITDVMGSLRALAERGMNRTLGSGIQLEARITGARPEEIHLGSDALLLHVIATGTAALRLDGAVFSPKADTTARTKD
ncbi:MAG TPA: DUF4403 family protein [Gemmatimonadales bacterium]